MSITIQELEGWLALPAEHEQLEFKEAKNQFDTTKLFKYCVAIANEGGGKLILGVTDKLPRKVVGSQAFLNLGEIKAKLLDKLRIRVDADEVIHPNGRVVVFHIPSRPIATPLEIEGSYLMRSGEALVAMTPDQLKRIFAEGEGDFLSRTAKSDLSADEVVSLLDTQSYFYLVKTPYPTQAESVLERFVSERLIKKLQQTYEITNLGALLFANNLRDFDTVARKAARVIVYGGKSKLATKSDVIENRGYAVGFEPLIDYVYSHIPSNEVIGKALRENIKMFPAIAIRELIANALIHQNFDETGTSVMVEIYSDRIEIANPGKPFISTDRFIDEYRSRNERLADIMRRLRICEEKGSGIDKVISSIEAFQLPAPDFRVAEVHTIAILFAPLKLSEMSRNDKIRACYQHCCLKYVTNEQMTNQSLRERFNLSEVKSDVASRIIRDTLEAGKIKLNDPENSSKRYSRYIPFWA